MRPLRFLTIVALLLIVPLAAHAQQAPTNGVAQMLTQFNTISNAWNAPLRTIALATFGGLAVIDLVYFVGIKQILAGNFEIGNFMAALVHEVLYLSFFFWLLTTYSVTGPLIIKGFQAAAHAAGGLPMHPNDIFNAGTDVANKIGAQVSAWHPGDAVVMLLCGLIVQGCFVWIVASMVYVIAESYFVVTAGQILLMFGGIRFGSEIAIGLIRTCIGIGLKLYALQLIASVGTGLIQAWVNQIVAGSLQSILVSIGEVALLAAITTSVPHMFERMVTHVGIGSAANIVGAAAAIKSAGTALAKAAKAIVGVAAHTSGRVATGVSAGRLAAAQLGESTAAGTGPSSAAGRAATLVGSTARNMASAQIEDIGRGLRGTRSNLGSSPWRQSSSLNEQRQQITDAKNKPPQKGTP